VASSKQVATLPFIRDKATEQGALGHPDIYTPSPFSHAFARFVYDVHPYLGVTLSYGTALYDVLLSEGERAEKLFGLCVLAKEDIVQFAASSLYHWAACSYPTVRMGHKLAASLMFTKPGKKQRIRFPWPSFRLEVPEGVLSVPADAVGKEGYITDVHVHRIEDEELGCGLWVLRLAGKGVGSASMFTDTLVTPLLDVGSMLHIGEKTSKAMGRFYVMLLNLLYGTSLFLTKAKKTTVHVGGAKRRGGKRRKAKGVTAEVYTLAPGIDVGEDLRRQVRSFVHGERVGAGGRLTMQFVVCGHYRRQAYGPGWSRRKIIWIKPFWKGPEKAVALIREYDLGDGPEE